MNVQFAADSTLTAQQLGVFHMDCRIYYIDVIVHDSDNAFTGGNMTLYWGATAGATTTTIDVIAVTTDDYHTTVDYDDLTSNAPITAGSFISVTTGWAFTMDNGCTIIFWVHPENAN
jgi:hypothetical protein